MGTGNKSEQMQMQINIINTIRECSAGAILGFIIGISAGIVGNFISLIVGKTTALSIIGAAIAGAIAGNFFYLTGIKDDKDKNICLIANNAIIGAIIGGGAFFIDDKFFGNFDKTPNIIVITIIAGIIISAASELWRQRQH